MQIKQINKLILGAVLGLCVVSHVFADDTNSVNTTIPVDEINNGLWPAIIEFLQENVNWTLYQHFSNNNGLTILKKI